MTRHRSRQSSSRHRNSRQVGQVRQALERQARQLITANRYESPEHAAHDLGDDRSHGSEYIAEAANRVLSEMPFKSVTGRTNKALTLLFVMRVLRYAKRFERGGC